MGRLKGQPHVLQLIGVSFNDLNPVLVVELAEGGNLEDYLEENIVEWTVKLKLAMEIALGVETVHEAGIVYVILRFVLCTQLLMWFSP